MSRQDDNQPLIRVENVWKRRGGNMILKGVNLDVNAGEAMCLLGPSGGGKSTLLRCVNAIEMADRGVVYVDGVPVACHQKGASFVRMREREVCRQRAEIGMVFQNFSLFPHMSVLENIMDAPIRVRGERKADVVELAYHLLQRVGLADKASNYPRQLSGGQQQRVAIARALAMKPKIMLFDEPTSALDPHLTHEVLDVIRSLREEGMTMIIVTHEIQFAYDLDGLVAVMAGGSIAEQGPARQVLRNPRDEQARAFLSRTSVNETRQFSAI